MKIMSFKERQGSQQLSQMDQATQQHGPGQA